MGWGEMVCGAGDEIRTRDIYLGKVVLYQLSYSRINESRKGWSHLQPCGHWPAELLPRTVWRVSAEGKNRYEMVRWNRNKKTPAPTYSSGMLPSKYHWRSCVSRPSSAWSGVVPQRCEHGGICC